MTPKDALSQLIYEASQLRNQADQALSIGIHSDDAPIVGEFLVKALIPHGLRGVARKLGSSGRKVSKSNVRSQWRQIGNQLLSQCIISIREMSINLQNISDRGNSSKLITKFNRVRHIKNPVAFFDTLITVLDEIRNLDLIWNKDICGELTKRKATLEQEQKERAVLKASSPKLDRLARTVDIYNRLSISEQLKRYPNVQLSILGALDCLLRGGPDAERQCITSCRVSIEALCIQIGENGDWKTALGSIFQSETDQKAVKGVWNYLSGKGAHAGHNPTKEEAEYGLKITIATLEQIASRRNNERNQDGVI